MIQEIKEVKINKLKSYQDITDEWYADYDIDFILTIPCIFDVFGTEYTIDRIKMTPEHYGGETNLNFANSSNTFEGIKIPDVYLILIYEKVLNEQENGVLKDWGFDEDIAEMLPENYFEDFDEDLDEDLDSE